MSKYFRDDLGKMTRKQRLATSFWRKLSPDGQALYRAAILSWPQGEFARAQMGMSIEEFMDVVDNLRQAGAVQILYHGDGTASGKDVWEFQLNPALEILEIGTEPVH